MTLGRLDQAGVTTHSVAASIETYPNLLGATAIRVPFDQHVRRDDFRMR